MKQSPEVKLAWRLSSSDELHQKLSDLLGRDPIREAEIDVSLMGSEPKLNVRMIPGAWRSGRREPDGTFSSGYTLTIERHPPVEIEEGEFPTRVVRITVSMHVLPEKKAVAVDATFKVHQTKIFGDDVFREYPLTGTVEWSEPQEIPYQPEVWDKKTPL